jgi:hypothetical protein
MFSIFDSLKVGDKILEECKVYGGNGKCHSSNDSALLFFFLFGFKSLVLNMH